MIFIFVILVVGTNEGVGFYYSQCNEEDANFFSCLFDKMSEEEEEPEEGTVTATGVYTYKGYPVTIVFQIPLKGGAVTGSVSDTCEGGVQGNYAEGRISGSMSGVCSPFFVNIPAGAEFNGSVNKAGKTVPITFTGRGGGITHEGSMTLTYP